MAFNHIQYNIQYAKENTRRIALSLNKNTEADMIEYLETVKNINGYIKQLIREDMEKQNQQKKT